MPVQAERDRCRAKWVHEDELINHRTTWLLASQSVLLAGVVATLALPITNTFTRAGLFVVLATIGLVLTTRIRRGLFAASAAMFVLARSSARNEYLRDAGLLDTDKLATEATTIGDEIRRFERSWEEARLDNLAARRPRPAAWLSRRFSRPIDTYRLPSMNEVARRLASERDEAGNILTERRTPEGSPEPRLRADLPDGLTWEATVKRATPDDEPFVPSDIEWPYWRPDVTSHTSRGGMTASDGLSSVVLAIWVVLLAIGLAIIAVAPDGRDLDCTIVDLARCDSQRTTTTTIVDRRSPGSPTVPRHHGRSARTVDQ